MRNRRLSLGKLPTELLRKYVLSMTGAKSDLVYLPPEIGLDFGVVRLSSGYLIVSSDPVTGVREDVGRYAVNVSANDIATSGNRPQFMQSILLFPESASEKLVGEVSSQVHRTAEKLGIAIVGGHTELTPRLNHVIVVATSFAVVDSFITAAQAKQGDTIMMTKVAGLEGTSILATDWRRLELKLPSSTIERAKGFENNLSVVKDARAAFMSGGVHAMHDCTEGGVLGAVYEMAFASRLGFELHERRIPVAKETRLICDSLNIDPLKLIGSGALLLAVERGKEKRVRQGLDRLNVPVAEIGRFTEGSRVLISSIGESKKVRTAPTDELWRLTR
jgi:hydrogenase maturation factor